MKKILTALCIFFTAIFLCSPCVFSQDNTTLINPDGTVNAPQKKSFFDFFKRKKKQPVQNLEGKGYYGTLPDIEGDFEYKKESIKSAPKQYSEKDIKDGLLLDAPLDDPLFLDVIIKKDKNSDYLNDLMKVKETLEKLKECINTNASIQFFNANVNVLDLQTKNLERKYQYTAYARTNSYYAVRHVNYSAKVLGNLKFDANFYSRYMPLQDSIYTPQNIRVQSNALLEEIDRTIFEIGNAR